MQDLARRDFLRIGLSGVAASILVPGMPHRDALAQSAAKEFDIRSFGAKGDGQTIDSPAINKAIESASAAHGSIRVPEGSYLCYSILLKSNVTLNLDSGATIIAGDSARNARYDQPERDSSEDHESRSYSHNSLIWGENLSNISILGPGHIWGRGLGRGTAETAGVSGTGNKSISLTNCLDVILRDFSILHGGHFAVLATHVDNITVDNLTVDTNRDGIDFDCCSNVHVVNCKVNSPWDDGICLKSSDALGFTRPTEHVTIENCYVTAAFREGTFLDGTREPIEPGSDAPRIGRIKCGTESNGCFRNITITNCAFDGCRGLALETVDGGILENIEVSNLKMRDIQDVPFFLRLGARMHGARGASVGQFRNVSISNVTIENADSRQCSIISGIPDHKIENVKFTNIQIQHRGGGTREDATVEPPEKEKAYPEPIRLGSMPAHGFFIRHVKGIEMRDIKIQPATEDLRPAFVLRDVEKTNFTRIELPVSTAPLWSLKNVKDFGLTHSQPLADVHLDKVKEKTF